MSQVQLTHTQMPVSSFLSQTGHDQLQILLPPSRTLVSDRHHLREIINRLDQMSHRKKISNS